MCVYVYVYRISRKRVDSRRSVSLLKAHTRLMWDSCTLVDNNWSCLAASRATRTRSRIATRGRLIFLSHCARSREAYGARARENTCIPSYVKRGIPANYSPVAEGRKPRGGTIFTTLPPKYRRASATRFSSTGGQAFTFVLREALYRCAPMDN